MIDVYRKLFELFDRRERRRCGLLFGIIVIAAFAEVLGISTFMLLLAVLAEPQRIAATPALSRIYDGFGFGSPFEFQVALSLAVFAVVLAGLAMKAGSSYAVIRFSAMRGYTISSRLLQAYLHQPYSWFLNRNTADIGKNVLSEVESMIGRVCIPALRLLANILLASAILIFLLVIDTMVAMVSILFIGGGYALIYLWLRGKLQRLGHEIFVANRDRFKVTQEASGGFKEVKLAGLEESYVDRFSDPSRRRARNMATSQILSELPRFALEALTFAILLGVVLFLLMRHGGDMAAIIPTLGIFAYSVMRMLPAAQQIYNSLVSIRAGKPSLDHVHDDYCNAINTAESRYAISDLGTRLNLTRNLKLEGVYYAYPAAERRALENLSLVIPALSVVGIVGGTGAGKTTLIDLILGLLSPEAGTLRVDDIPIDHTSLRRWQQSIGYVPQNIYLTDDTVAANIAFGLSPDAIDQAEVERAARIAALHDFVASDLPQGYATVVGERGIRLSGGQRQRIGIARALYHNPSLLILDEATSALDTITEGIVMEAVNAIRADKTIIVIAHRLSTVRDCDVIYLMEQGRIAARGTYDELAADNPTFRRMVANG